MGSVYKALQVSLEREVAVKVLSKELASKPSFVQRFLREARVMAKLDHPNILRCFDVGAVQGFHYLSMEYVDGGSVEGWLKKLGKLSIGDSLYIILACAHALQHAHELNLVHRDIKPDNILLTKRGVVKVADLGLAKAQDDDMSLTKTGTGAGTPLFMAPEQARDVKRVDGRCDIYSLGGMLYNFLTGQPPFIGETLVELIEIKEKGKYKPVRDFNDEVPERLELIVAKLLSTKPEHRYQTCAELILELENLGLANDRLSFVDTPEGAPPRQAPTTVSPKRVAVPGLTRASNKTPAPTTKPSPKKAEAEDFWYATFTTSAGKSVTRKLTKDQMITLIRSKSFTDETQVSRTLKGGYRALGTYKEFQSFFKGQEVKETADKKGQKYRSLYAQIEKEDARRRRWRWLHNSFLRFGGFVGLILWLALIGLLLTGVYFGLKWGLTEMGVDWPF
jgi:serine/threonine-protein kinase